MTADIQPFHLDIPQSDLGDALPLLITHGYPSSFVEFEQPRRCAGLTSSRSCRSRCAGHSITERSDVPRLSFVAVLLLALSFLTGCSKDDPANAQPGNCLEALGQDPKTTGFHIVDCGAPNAAYKVALRLGRFDSCQTNTYGYATSGGSRRSGWHLCLTLNAKVGDCFHQEVGFPTGKAVKVPCGAGATYRVVKSVPGTADKALCGEDAVDPVRNDLARPIALVYPQPPLTICTDRA